MKMLGSGGIAPPFLTLALDLGKWSASCPGRFTVMLIEAEMLLSHSDCEPTVIMVMWKLCPEHECNSLFTDHPNILHYIVWATDSVVK
jgi:hypothetical protein